MTYLLSVDAILAASEEELRAIGEHRLRASLFAAEVKFTRVTEAFSEADSNLSALAAETVPESTGTAVDEIYDDENCDPSLEHYLDEDGNHQVEREPQPEDPGREGRETFETFCWAWKHGCLSPHRPPPAVDPFPFLEGSDIDTAQQYIVHWD